MGCCSVKDDKLLKDNNNGITIDFAKLNSNGDSVFGQNTTQDKAPISMEYAKSFFKQKTPNQQNELGDTVGNNLLTREEFNNKETIKKELSSSDEYNEKRNREEEKINSSLMRNSLRENGEVILYPRLEMTIVNSRGNSQNNEKIIITPNSINGIVKKMGDKFLFGRNLNDQNIPTHSLMGSLQNFVQQNTLNPKQNDYNFTDESIGSRQFEISFNKEKEKFYIVDNKKGTGLFVKVKNYVVVDHDMIVSFCASHMILQVEPEVYHPENKIIKIRFLQGPHQNQEKIFNSKDKKIIRIGRSKQAEVVYKDDSVSRIQCTIVFERGDWNLYDGYLDNGNKGSTNGLWLLASSKLEMTNDMVLKTGNTTLFVKLSESESD